MWLTWLWAVFVADAGAGAACCDNYDGAGEEFGAVAGVAVVLLLVDRVALDILDLLATNARVPALSGSRTTDGGHGCYIVARMLEACRALVFASYRVSAIPGF